MMPEFSVIVPIYNVEKYLNQCVDSILSQKYENFELILVDDGSKDKCGAICDEYSITDSRVRVIHKKNGGLVDARNTGVEHAKGEYTLYVDGDDWVSSDWLQVIHNAIKEIRPDIVSFNAYKSIDGKNQPLITSKFIGTYLKERINAEILPRLLYDCKSSFYEFGILPAVWAKAFKTELLKKNLCRDTRITFGEDTACSYSCIIQADSYVGIDNNLYFYRQNRESMTKAYDARRFERISILFDYLDKTLILKDENIKEQYVFYRAFCILYAILNESKNTININQSANNCRKNLEKYHYIKELKEIKNTNIGFFWKLIHSSIINNRYLIAMILCRAAVKLKYSYKG